MSYIDLHAIHPDLVMVQTDDAKLMAARTADGVWQAGSATVSVKDGEWTLESPEMPVRRVLLRWKNEFDRSALILNDQLERGYGDLEWRGYNAERILPWYFMMREGDRVNGYGVMTNANAICLWQVTESDVSLYLDVRSLGAGVRLGGKRLSMAKVVSRAGDDGETAFESTRAFCAVMCKNGIFVEQPVYGSNNWYYAYGHSSAEEILQDTDRVVAWTEGLENRPFMVIDDCWQSSIPEYFGGVGGPYLHGNEKFPDMAGLAAEMKARGVRPGIWCRPLITTAEVPEHWVVHHFEDCGWTLDPTIPEVLQLIGEDISRIRSWGYELIKHDYSTFDIFGEWGIQGGAKLTTMNRTFNDPSVTTAEAVQMLYKTIYDNAGGALIIGCNTIGHLITGYAQIQRTGDDTSGRIWERTRKMGVNTLSHRMAQHNIFFTVDADCVGATNDVSWEMNSQWMDVLSRSATALFISPDPAAMTPEIDAAVREAFARASRNTQMLIPLDWESNVCPTLWTDGTETYRYNWNQPDRFVFADDDIKP